MEGACWGAVSDVGVVGSEGGRAMYGIRNSSLPLNCINTCGTMSSASSDEPFVVITMAPVSVVARCL